MKLFSFIFPSDLLKSELLKNTSVLISGTVIAQLIPILLQPFLRRFFLPEAFGTFSVYLSLIGIITIISCLRYEDAIVLPGNDKESINILFLTLIISLILNIVFFIIILLTGERLLRMLNLPSGITTYILYLIPVGSFLYNTFQIFNNWLIRRKKYYSVSLSKLIRRGGEASGQVTFALTGVLNGLIISDIIGQVLNVITVLLTSIKSGFNFKLISRVKMKYVAAKYSEFPKYNLIPALLSALSFYLPTLFINRYFSPESTGYFDLTKMLLSVPLALVATSFSNVLLQSFSEKYQKKQTIMKEVKHVFFIVGTIIIIGISFIYLIGTEFFVFAFGEQWRVSGEISKILIWSFAFNFLVSTFSCIYISMRKIKIYSIWQFIYFILIISLMFFRDRPFYEFLKIYVILEVIAYMLISVNMFKTVMKYENLILNKNEK